MRQVVLDTETTGLEWQKGNRVVEIGCVELLERRPTGRTFHTYLCPDRDFEPGAQEVTGLTVEFLADKPRFHEVADELLAFIDGAEVLIPMAGLIDKDAELARLAKEVAKVDVEIGKIESKLANEGFVARAPEAVIAKERERLVAFADAKTKLIEQQAVIAAL